jgi:hypothetical protein
MIDKGVNAMAKNYNTGFAVMVEGGDFVKENGQVCIFSLMQAKMKMNELKAQGYEVRAVPFCR